MKAWVYKGSFKNTVGTKAAGGMSRWAKKAGPVAKWSKKKSSPLTRWAKK